MPNISAIGVLGNGLKAAYSTSSPLSWIQIPDIMAIDTPFDLITPDIDTSVSGVTIKTSMGGVADPPQPGFTKLSDPNPATGTAEEYLRLRQLDGVAVWFRFEVPTNRTATLFIGEIYQATVKQFMRSSPIFDKQTVKIVLRYAGNRVYDSAVGASQIS
jgi:hypothetical protein